MTQFTCKGVKQINNRISLNMTFTFTIRISWHFSSAQEFQMGNFQKFWSQNVGQDFIDLIFFTGGRFWKLTGGTLKIGRKNLCWGEYRVGGKGVCGRLMSPAQETQSMREIRLLHGRRLTGMLQCVDKKKVEQEYMYIKCNCGHSILLLTQQYAGDSNSH
jgi:hypothetical protein